MNDEHTNNLDDHAAQELGSLLDRLAGAERASADAGFEARVLGAVRGIERTHVALDRLGEQERASAGVGFEGRVLDAVGAAVEPGPIPIERGHAATGGTRARVLRMRLAAGVLLAVSAGVLTWVGLEATSPERTPGDMNIAIERTSAEVIEEDLDLLWELVDSDVGSLVADAETGGAGFDAAMDDLALDLLRVDSTIDSGWGSLESWVDSLEEGAI